jgi:oligopeptide transport system substrate-binding protein
MQRAYPCLILSAFLWCAELAHGDWLDELQPLPHILAKEQVLRFNSGSEPESLDPALISGSQEIDLVNSLFEGLLCYDPRDLKLQPAIASHWELSNDGCRYTFHLRPSLWSNGERLTALDFERSWRRVLEPQTGAPYASLLFPIAGAQDYHSGKTQDFAKVGIKALDTSTFEVTLHHPCPYFLDCCAFVTLFPVHLKSIEKYKDQWIRPENLVCNGPFQLQTWSARQELILVKNPNYYDHHRVHLTSIEAKLIDDHDTAYKLYQKGDLDWINTIPLPKVEEAKWDPSYYAMPFMGVYFYRFNTTKKPFDEPKVRRAFSISVYRQAITQQVLRGGEQPAAFFCPPVGGYQPIEGLRYNPSEGNRLLDESGYQDRTTFPETELFFNTSEAHKKIAETLVEQWKNNLGIYVKLRNSEWKVFLQSMSELNFDLCRSSWIGDYGDPNTFFDLFYSKGGNNRTGWKHAAYDKLLIQSQLELDSKVRHQIFQTMERILVEEECPIIPLYLYVNKGMLAPKIGGWYENIRDIHPLKTVYIKAGL